MNQCSHCGAQPSPGLMISLLVGLVFAPLAVVAAGTPTVDLPTVSAVTTSGASFAGYISSDGGSASSVAGFNYGPSTDYGGSVSTPVSFRTGAFGNTVSNLQCGTTYNVQAFAVNSSGTGLSANATFTTADCPQPAGAPGVDVTEATAVGDTSVTLNGTISSTGGIAVTARGFNYGTDGSTFPATLSETGSFGQGPYSLAVNGLMPGTTYYYQAFATNGGGTTVSPGVKKFLTSGTAVPSAETSAASSVGVTQATLNGILGHLPTSLAIERGFNYGTSATYGATTSESGTFGSGAYSLALNGLNAATQYHFRAYGSSQSGMSYGSDLTFTTASNPTPPPPSSGSSASVGGGSSSGGGSYSSGSASVFNAYSALLARTATSTAPVATIPGCPVGYTCRPIVGPAGAMAGVSMASTSLFSFDFTNNLAYGNTSSDVLALQMYLNSRGYTVAATDDGSPGRETTYFGNLTKNALMRFQKDHGLPAFGYFGPMTRALINVTEP